MSSPVCTSSGDTSLSQNPRYSTRLHPWTANVLGFIGALPCAVEKSIVFLSFLALARELYAGIGVRMMVRSSLLFSYGRQSVTFGAEGTGFDSCYLPKAIINFIKRCYDKEEFDTDHS